MEPTSTVTPVLTAFVNIPDFRKAVRAAVPHAGHPKTNQEFAFVNFLVTDAVIYVSATDQYTMGCSLISVEDSQLSGSLRTDQFDLSIEQAKELPALFRPAAGKEEEAESTLRIEVFETELIFTDVSGLLPGKVVKLPREQADHGVSAPRIMRRVLDDRAARTAAKDDVPDLDISWLSTVFLKRFVTSAEVYEDTFTIKPTTDARKLLIEAGESFIGTLMARTWDEGHDEVRERVEASQSWQDRLGSLGDALARHCSAGA